MGRVGNKRETPNQLRALSLSLHRLRLHLLIFVLANNSLTAAHPPLFPYPPPRCFTFRQRFFFSFPLGLLFRLLYMCPSGLACSLVLCSRLTGLSPLSPLKAGLTRLPLHNREEGIATACCPLRFCALLNSTLLSPPFANSLSQRGNGPAKTRVQCDGRVWLARQPGKGLRRSAVDTKSPQWNPPPRHLRRLFPAACTAARAGKSCTPIPTACSVFLLFSFSFASVCVLLADVAEVTPVIC